MLATLTRANRMDLAAIAFSNTHRKERSRLTLFCAASVVLHALALVVNPPSGAGMAQGLGGVPTVLHAVLSPLHAAFESTPVADSSGKLVADPAPAIASSSQDASHKGKGPAAAAGGFTAGAFPVPDKWLSADELSVRAEPLTDVQIDYPASLAASGVVGRVTLLLLIDERGIVRKAQVEESLPEGVFDSAALSAWADVRFSPALKDGLAVKSRKLLEISFLP